MSHSQTSLAGRKGIEGAPTGRPTAMSTFATAKSTHALASGSSRVPPSTGSGEKNLTRVGAGREPDLEQATYAISTLNERESAVRVRRSPLDEGLDCRLTCVATAASGVQRAA